MAPSSKFQQESKKYTFPTFTSVFTKQSEPRSSIFTVQNKKIPRVNDLGASMNQHTHRRVQKSLLDTLVRKSSKDQKNSKIQRKFGDSYLSSHPSVQTK